MKVTFAVCADRAVGFGAALVGLVLLFLTARHLLAPIATPDPLRAYDAVAHAAIVRPEPRPSVAHPARPVHTVHVRVAAAMVRRPSPRATVRIVSRASTHATVRASRSIAYRRPASHPIVVVDRGVGAPAPTRVTSTHLARPVAPSRGASPGNRSSDVSKSRAPSKTRPHPRPTAPTTFRIPARFDVRPALVTVSDASVATLPADDALPTIVPHARRR